MRDCTNLSWPEGPFGADQRPFGRPQRILMSLVLELDDRTPVAVTTAYFGTHRTRVLDVTADTLSIGFRTTVTDGWHDETALLDLIDRALVRGRRHALIEMPAGLSVDERVRQVMANVESLGLLPIG